MVIGRRAEAPAGEIPIRAARYVPPPPGDDLKARLADLLAWSNVSHRPHIDPVVEAAMVHYTFEALHPFHDGNGRLGRLFVVLHLHRLGVLSEPAIAVVERVPVSYTHLRAHETVLDLVCRLLLEKKQLHITTVLPTQCI